MKSKENKLFYIIKVILLVMLILFLIFIVLTFSNGNVEKFACIAREYLKVEEEGETSYEPIQFGCSNFDDKGCKSLDADCIQVNIDEEAFDEKSPESDMVLNMFTTCMQENPNIKMDKRCMLSNSSDLEKCMLQNKTKTYAFNDKCALLPK